MSSQFPITERLPLGLLLAANAGALDAYTYVAHGGVFAGLQTGNMILMGVSGGRGDWRDFIAHLIPFLVFGVGTIIIRRLQHALNTPEAKRRRAIIVLIFELALAMLMALTAAHVPDLITNSLGAILAAAQLQEFRRLNGGPFTFVMMTGNLRTTAEGLYDWFAHGDRAQLRHALHTLATILALVAGAAMATLATHWLGGAGIVMTAPLLLAGVIYICIAQA